jgi:hypothetical protein
MRSYFVWAINTEEVRVAALNHTWGKLPITEATVARGSVDLDAGVYTVEDTQAIADFCSMHDGNAKCATVSGVAEVALWFDEHATD